MTFELWGALLFGVVVGWICYRTLRRSTDPAKLSDLATVVGVIGGGGVVTALFKSGDLFASYAIGLAIGFFLYLIIGFLNEGRSATAGWMFDKPK
jgi:ammonia channel protein AmtB